MKQTMEQIKQYKFRKELNGKLVAVCSKVTCEKYHGIYEDTSAFTFKLTCANGSVCGTKELWTIENVESVED